MTSQKTFVSGPVTKDNAAVHFPPVPYSVDIIKLLLGKRTSVKLTKREDENPQHVSAEFDNLGARKSFFFLLKRCCFEKRS